ncbi:MAG: helix-turn-helix transcriptional regulator [Clostridia bacterium]|nr:helix-turn-helix transcriptional regulator [Clostridia bacterium]
MVDLKLVIASNIIKLRTDAGMTQSELGAKLNYSDKSISKWERAESLPDANVLKQMGEIFGVSMDYLFNTHDDWTPDPEPEAFEKSKVNHKAVEAVALCGVATFALFLFILFWIILDKLVWIVFFAALPVAILTHLVLNSVWNKGKRNILIVGAFIFSLLLLIYVALIRINPWQIFLLMLPTAAILFFVSKIRKKRQ